LQIIRTFPFNRWGLPLVKFFLLRYASPFSLFEGDCSPKGYSLLWTPFPPRRSPLPQYALFNVSLLRPGENIVRGRARRRSFNIPPRQARTWAFLQVPVFSEGPLFLFSSFSPFVVLRTIALVAMRAAPYCFALQHGRYPPQTCSKRLFFRRVFSRRAERSLINRITGCVLFRGFRE